MATGGKAKAVTVTSLDDTGIRRQSGSADRLVLGLSP